MSQNFINHVNEIFNKLKNCLNIQEIEIVYSNKIRKAIMYDMWFNRILINPDKLIEFINELANEFRHVNQDDLLQAFLVHELLHAKLRKSIIKHLRMYLDVENALTYLGYIIEEIEHKIILDLTPFKQIEYLMYMKWFNNVIKNLHLFLNNPLSIPKVLIKFATGIIHNFIQFNQIPKIFRKEQFVNLVNLLKNINPEVIEDSKKFLTILSKVIEYSHDKNIIFNY